MAIEGALQKTGEATKATAKAAWPVAKGAAKALGRGAVIIGGRTRDAVSRATEKRETSRTPGASYDDEPQTSGHALPQGAAFGSGALRVNPFGSNTNGERHFVGSPKEKKKSSLFGSAHKSGSPPAKAFGEGALTRWH